MTPTLVHKLIGAIALSAVLAGCGSVPITGRKSLNLVSDSEVLSASREQYASFVSQSRQRGEIVQDARISRIANNLINATKTYLANNGHQDIWRQMQWEVNIVKSNQVNAFCMPGGKIVVYTGIVQLIGLNKGADDELAAVIGHEIGHAIAKHTNERLSQAKLNNIGGQILGEMVSNQSALTQTAVGVLFNIGTEVGVTLPFNRKQELEADKIGLVLMALAGYNPEYAVSLWQKMATTSTGRSSTLFSTHPSEEKRIREIQAFLPTALRYYQQASAPKATPKPNRNRVGAPKK